ncbi:MAG TPA: alpha-2-macroglobulin family protein, partial [Candidatus Solibacter sp.]|nr:alpha-2-macroglobulin family protein [Candidatus Solibacter sp.]
VPEGGTLIPNLENQVFILTSYPDGTPAKTNLTVHLNGSGDQRVTSDEGGVAVVRVHANSGTQTLKVDAGDKEGNQASTDLMLETRTGDEQILLRTERAIYRAGDRIQLKILSSKERGTAYIDLVKEGQTVLTRDVELVNGQAELSLAATPDLAGTVDVNAYLFGRNARPVGDHRLVFVQPADELKIEASTDGAVYRPGDEARLHLRVTNSHGEGVSAALGLQVVDEAVFALAEKQPGFAKVFFYLEQEVMKPRYEIHSVGMQEIVEPVEQSKLEQKDRAARALFSATELVEGNKFETEFGRTVPMTRYPEYFSRYQAAFRAQVERLATRLHAEAKAERTSDLTKVFEKLKKANAREMRDSWGNEFRIEAANWFRDRRHYVVRSIGGDRQFYSADDLAAYIEIRRGIVAGPPDPNHIGLRIEHDRGPFNGLAEIAGTVIDPSGAVIPGAGIEVHDAGSGKKRKAHCNNAGEFSLPGLPAGDYTVQITSPGFQVAQMQRIALQPRDRAVLSVTLQIGAATETVEVTAAPAGFAGGVGGGIAGGVMGGIVVANGGPVMLQREMTRADAMASPVPPTSNAVLVTGADKRVGSTAVRVRSYFPEALYINPEIITDKDGRASVSIPLADSITTWRTAMLASTVRGALGTATSSVKVFQDFFVDLDMPVTLTQGDRISIPVAVYNYSPAKGDVDLQLHEDQWFSLVDDAFDKSVSVDSARVGGSQFTLEAKRIGKFKLTLTANMKGDAERADVVVREIEVVPNGREQSLVFNGRLENQIEHEVSFPEAAIPEASKIFVRLYPGPLSQVVEGMDTLLRMPYGCFEQTSSTTYPNVLALDYMKRTKKLTPEVHAKAEGFIANGYQRLLTFEVPGGGFSWFGNAPANKILTSYGLMEFYDMSKVHDVDPRLIQRTQQWLASQQQPDGGWKPDPGGINEGAINRYTKDVVRITAYIAWSLENTGYQGPAVEKAKRYVQNHMDGKIDAYTLAVIANFAVDYQKDRDFTRRAMQFLLDARTEKDDTVWWSAEETSVYATGASAAV